MINDAVVLLSRIQFGLTAMYHFIFVPLTLGLSVLLGIMETIYVMTGRKIWREITQFWGILFGINFAMGVATGITMEFQFGTNWAYYSHYVGDIFGVPLAIEGLMAFFLEATFIGLFFFGWQRLSKTSHLTITWLVAIGSSFSALWILIANGWMQHPVGAHFDFHTMRMEVESFSKVLFNPVAQAKFVHTICSGYVTGAMFVVSISAFYLLRQRNVEFAKRSIAVAASFGLAAALAVVVLGDESGHLATAEQRMKIAAIEGVWETEPAPAPFNLFGIPDRQQHVTHYRIQIPYMLGIMATRSIDEPLIGINQLVAEAKPKIRDGIKAYSALRQLQRTPHPDPLPGVPGRGGIYDDAKIALEKSVHNLGYGLLLKRITDDPEHATDKQIDAAAWSTVPEHVGLLFWSFRLMVGCGMFFILLFATTFYFSSKRTLIHQPWLLRIILFSLPLPWIAAEAGWFVAEHGRQPWVIDGILPTGLGVSSVAIQDLWISLTGFILFYTILAVVDLLLMIKYVRLGPEKITHPGSAGGPPALDPPPPKNTPQPPALPGDFIMLDYALLRIIWWVLLGILICGFAIMDGFDLGVASLLPFVARNDVERRITINTVGPIWEGNQVWFILSGGAIFAAWPMIYAVSFSCFYLAMFLVLITFILRPVAFKYRSKIVHVQWRSTWDWILCVSGLVVSLVFGIAVGNVLQGIPFHFDEDLRAYYTGTVWQLFNPFALLCGLASVAMLMMQGGFYLATKTDGIIHKRANISAYFAALTLIILFAVGGLWIKFGINGYLLLDAINFTGPSNPLYKQVASQTGQWLMNFENFQWMMIAPGLGFIGAGTAVFLSLFNYPRLALVMSSMSVFGVVTTVGLSMFPFILPSSSHPSSSLLVWDSSSSQLTLFIMLIATAIFLPIILLYTSWVYRVLRGKVTEQHIHDNHHSY